MALSGSFYGYITGGSGDTTSRIRFDWNVFEQSVNDRTSSISWQLVFDDTSSNESTIGTYHNIKSVQILSEGAVAYYSNEYEGRFYHEDVIDSGTLVVPHELNGALTWDVSFTVHLYRDGTSYNVGSTTQHIEINSVAVASRVTVNSGVIGSNVVISIAKADSTYLHTLSYAFGDLNETILEMSDKGGVLWTIPTSFYNQIPNSTYGIGEIYCDTYTSTGKYVGTSFMSFRASVGDIKPEVTVTIEEADQAVKAITGGNYFLQFMSDAKYEITATALHGASIKSYSVKNGSTTYDTASGTFTDVADGVFEVIVTDSRGLITTVTVTKVVNGYTKVTSNLTLSNLDPNGTVDMTVSGNYFNRDFYNAAKPNSLTVTVDCLDPNGNTTTKTVEVTLYDDYTYRGTVKFTGLDYKLTYYMTAHAADLLTSASSAQVIVTFVPVFDWSKTDFRFNVPITKIGDYEFADFICEVGETSMGSNGKWYWRKWASGRAECTGSRNFGVYNISKNSVGMYRGAVLSQDFPAGLFVDEPHYINMKFKHSKSSTSEGTYAAIVSYVGTDQALGETITYPSATNTGTFALCLPSNTTGVNITLPASHICFEVVGRWK